MEQITIAAKPRPETGSHAVSKLRREGKVPGIVYGHQFGEPLPISIEARDLLSARDEREREGIRNGTSAHIQACVALHACSQVHGNSAWVTRRAEIGTPPLTSPALCEGA